MVALPETVVHCAGRSLYHRIKRGSGAVCLPSMPRVFPDTVEPSPINFRVQLSLSKLPKSCELHLADYS